MWDLVATAATGLAAGAGLQCLVAPVSSESATLDGYAKRFRNADLLLSTIGCSSAVAAHVVDERGPLWLVAAAVVGLNVPFGMLLLGTPKPLAPVEPWNMHAYSAAVHGTPLEYSSGQATPTKCSPHEGFDMLPPGDDPRATLGRHFPKPALHVTGGQIAAWKRKVCFQAILSFASFAGMLVVLSTHMDHVAYGGYAPL